MKNTNKKLIKQIMGMVDESYGLYS